jgi:5-methyltetrahydrofolate--homocysteine methyltransferase
MSTFVKQLARRRLVLDGAMGTSLQKLDLDLEADYWGKENCSEVLVLSRPDVLQTIHGEFLAAGADAVETDTFGGMTHVLAEFDLQDRCRELNRKACEIARAACDEHATPDRPRFVVGSIGPGTKLISLQQIDWDTLYDSYAEQAHGLLDGGADVLLIETAQDVLHVKCVINAITDVMAERGLRSAMPRRTGVSPVIESPVTDDGRDARPTKEGPPIMVQVTIEQFGTTLTGSEIAAVATSLEGYPILSLGLNCATGPRDMTEHVKWLGRNWPRHVSVLPNAGLPTLVEGQTVYPLGPGPFADVMAELTEKHDLSIVGGCCGTTPEHIAALHDRLEKDGLLDQPAKRDVPPLVPGVSSLFSAVELRQDASLLNVGERCNASGSRKFKRLLEKEDWDAIVSLGRDQMKEGSHVLDVNVDYAGRDNAADMRTITQKLVRQVNAPLMLDSTQIATIEAGLQQSAGKCLINSANFEDGEEKFAQMCQLAKRYHAALVLGTIDEDPEEAMARTADRKLAIAQRLVKTATEQHGLAVSDLMIDPLVLPISTGMDKDRRSALETIEGTRRIAGAMPEVQLTCGLSNVSFGLKPAARQVLNSAFLHELREAGMTSAIIHVSKILPKNRIDDQQWDAALDLIYNRWRDEGDETKLADGSTTRDPLQIFIDLFPGDAKAQTTKVDLRELPLDERLRKHIIDGEKKHLDATLDQALPIYGPLAIINDHLLDGMKTVGELFGSGQMQLPFVLQSAEVMKTAVAHLEPHMEKVSGGDGSGKGSIVLATVKGDVHDIGKNLVDIILTNNGYTVHNIGIKQPINQIVAKWRETDADAIGLSGLLVKSVNVMEENLRELNTQGIDVPVLLGGAALAREYCEGYLRGIYDGRVYHGQDAFEGLRIMDVLKSDTPGVLDEEIEARMLERDRKQGKIDELKQRGEARKAEESIADFADDADADGRVATVVRSGVRTDVDVPEPPFWGDRVVEDISIQQIYPFVNTSALYQTQWQFTRGNKPNKEYKRQIAEEIEPLFEKLKTQLAEEGVVRPKVVYGYWPCNSDGDDLVVYDAQDHDREVQRFAFPRQSGRKHLCISDFFRPVGEGKDVLGLQCVTVGDEVSKYAKKLFDGNDYAQYLYIHGMGVEAAEALAEMWHKRMRQEMGIDADDSPKIRQLFTQKYRGSRYSFGYPACPDMSDQEKLFALLKPERIGCELTENWQIDPEQSTSAIVVHHPQAKYFNV